MKWLAKAFLQQTLSYLPQSDWWNYLFQRYLTKNFSTRKKEFLARLEMALMHFQYFTEYSDLKDFSKVSFYEFGVGWHLTIPLTYYFLGINNQTVTDIKPNIRFEIIKQVLPLFRMYSTEIEEKAGRQIRSGEHLKAESLFDLQEGLGITYMAPCDAANTGLPAGTFDFISNNFVMEHLPKKFMPAILQECWRILKPRGIMSCFIDMNDHYWLFDSSISRYNFLKFSDRQWSWLNPALHYQNRMRYPDYLELFKQAGFVVEAEEVKRPSALDLDTLRTIKTAPEFRKYPLEILGITSLKIVLRKP